MPVGFGIEAKPNGSLFMSNGPAAIGRAVRRHTRIELSKAAKRIIVGVKQSNPFRYKQKRAPATAETAPRARRGALKRSLWESKGRMDSKHVEHELGWGVPYGNVLEYGTPKRSWPIVPRGFRSDLQGRGGQQIGLQFLRFQVGNRIVYKKEVKHKWNKSMLRPHFAPVVQKLRPKIVRTIRAIPARVLNGELR